MLSNLFTINSVAIKLYKHLLSNSFTINLVTITFICYQASTAIETFAIKPHLLSGQFAINSQVHSTSVIICYQIFDLLSIFIFANFVSKKYPKKMICFCEKLKKMVRSNDNMPTTMFVFSKMTKLRFILNIIFYNCIIFVIPFIIKIDI